MKERKVLPELAGEGIIQGEKDIKYFIEMINREILH